MRKKDKGFFDEQFRLEKLSKQGDPFEKLNEVINWEVLRPIVEKAFPVSNPKEGGRPPYDRVMMFKILVIQSMYGLSDDELEYQILDRLSFMRFLGLQLWEDVPDCKTIWVYREALKKEAVFDRLFEFYRDNLYKAGLIMKNGSIVDASIVEVRRQRNSREENKQIKNGDIPDEWKDDPDKLRQKDIDARWTKKNGQNFFGYKNHVKVDSDSKLITEYQVTPANMHDSEAMGDLLNKADEGQELYGDSAYTGPKCKKLIRKMKMKNKIHEKGYRNNPLSEKSKMRNQKKSKVRARVEHIFGAQTMNQNASALLRYIGLERNAAAIGLRNIVYNFFRMIFLVRKNPALIPLMNGF